MRKGLVRVVLWIGIAALSASSANGGGRAWWQAPRAEDRAYLDLSMRFDPTVVGAEIGGEGVYNDYFSVRIGLELLVSEEPHDLFPGITAGARLTAPWRLAPFVGVGGFVGWWEWQGRAQADRVDNDWDGFVDEVGETKDVIIDGVIVVYPEVGVHLWLTDSLRLTLSGRYHMTTAGRAYDTWLANVGLSALMP